MILSKIKVSEKLGILSWYHSINEASDKCCYEIFKLNININTDWLNLKLNEKKSKLYEINNNKNFEYPEIYILSGYFFISLI